jgi:UDP-N-acetylglucosamine:LPS N-acetylglucosamine transferase
MILERDAGIFHPDLVNAGDAIIGKVGYSTLAETYQAGIPFGYIPRPAFRESPVLVDYIETKMRGLSFSESDLDNGQWLAKLPELLALPRLQRDQSGGAAQIARFVYKLMN